MKVLHCIPSLELKYGGPSQSTASLISAIARQPGFVGNVGLVCKRGEDEAAASGGVIRRDAAFSWERYWAPSPSTIALLRREAAKADIVHVHSYWNLFSVASINAARHAGRPLVLSPRGMLHADAIRYSSRLKKAMFKTMIARRQLSSVAGYHFQSSDEATGSEITRRYSTAPAIVLSNGVDLPKIACSVAEARHSIFGADGKSRHLLFFGRINRIKGIDLQIRALCRLRDYGQKVFLHLIGPDENQLDTLTTLAGELGVNQQVKHHGPIFDDSKFLWMRGADAVLMSSEFENNSNVALEVMASGGALVVTKGSVESAVADAGAALVVRRSEEALAGAVAHLLNDTTVSASLRENATDFVNTHNSWSTAQNT